MNIDATHAESIAQAFRITADRRGAEVAIRTKGDEQTVTWSELRDRSDAIAGGLVELGVKPGDTVALMLSNRPEFHICDVAVMTAGGTPFSIYQTYAPGQIAYIVKDAGARVAFVEQQYLGVFLQAREELPELEHVIVIDGDAAAGTIALADVEASGAGFDGAAAAARVKRDDVLTLIYTSGTTGPPKGVQLSHGNLLAAVIAVHEMVDFPEGSRVISWLPAAHVAERNAHHYLPIVFGLQITCCPDGRQVLSYLPEAAQPEEERAKTQAAIDAAIEKVRREQRGDPVPEALAEQVARADKEIFAGLRTMLGLDQVAAINVGAAPTPVDVLYFFHAIGLPLSELWGMSESCGAGTVNPIGKVRIGTVGPPAPGIEIKLAEDGEVLMRGDVVMLGYRNQPDKTTEAVDAERWLHTGDIGELDEEGYLKIVDRKKELIINAAGKNMSPANIEATVKTASPLIGQACCIGDARSYNTALIVLDADFAPAWAGKNGISEASLEQLAELDKVRAEVQKGVDQANAKLARVEQIKKFQIVRGDWLPGGDELTPTMKLKRKPIAEKYAQEIEAMYTG